jgi:Prolyl-tRNA synthetase
VRIDAGYAANVEAYRTPLVEPVSFDGLPEAVIHDSPNTPTIETLVALANESVPRDDRAWHAGDTLKNVVLALVDQEGNRELVVVGIPGDREVDMKRAEAWFGPRAVEPATEEDFERHPALVKGYIGPWSPDGPVLGAETSSGVSYFLDPRVADGTQWVTGANIPEKHVFYLATGRDFHSDGIADIAEVRDGDEAPDGSGPIQTARGMEIGHVFQLGRKYAEALGLQVLHENGTLVTVSMGSYGIRVTCIMAIIAEGHHDEKGLIWANHCVALRLHVFQNRQRQGQLPTSQKNSSTS